LAGLFSVTYHKPIDGAQVEHKPFTVAVNVTWPFSVIVDVAGETVTVTLLGLNPPPVLQPVAASSTTNVPSQMVRHEFIRHPTAIYA
jgi:hypothetical protein